MGEVRRTRWVAPALALAVAVALAGCGGSGQDGASAAATTSGATQGGTLRALLPEEIRQAGVIAVATDVPFPPFEYFASDTSKQIAGFDYDLGQALGARLGVKFRFQQQAFDGIIPALQARKYDVTISAVSDTAERRKVLDFVDYFNSGTGIMVPKGNPRGIRSLLDLCGRRVALQSGAQQVGFVRGVQPKCKQAGKGPIGIQTVPKVSDAQLAVRSGKADAVVEDKPSAAYQAKAIGDGQVFEVIDDPAALGGYNAEPGGIGVLKGREALVNALQKAVQSLMDDGSYTKILDRYGLRSIGIPRATVNGA